MIKIMDNIIRVVDVKVGLKITVKEKTYNELINNEMLSTRFKLNIKRLNRWWYSIYFDNKE